jgi:uncharacterized protein YndB with AHSA1/START domain
MTDSRKLQITTPTEREIVMTRVFDAPRRLLFDAHTKPELLKRWLFGPDGWSLAVCEVDLRPGGKYRYLWRHANKPDMGMGGVIREVVAPERLVTTEKFEQAFAAMPMLVPAGTEPQSEAVAYRPDGRGYYTTSEGNNPPVHRVLCQ